jgi:hypothetical protein
VITRFAFIVLFGLAFFTWSETPRASAALLKGDANCDGQVTGDDGLEVLKYKAALTVGAGCLQLANADCDFSIDELDALAIFRWLADPVASPSECPLIGTTPESGEVYANAEYLDLSGEGVNAVGVSGNDSGDMVIGDTGGLGLPNAAPNRTRRIIVSFPVGALEGDIESATLALAVTETRRDQYPDPGFIDGEAPYDNPQLGDALVLNVADPGDPTSDDYNAPSLGSDPGVLIPNGVDGPAFKLTIDVTAAVQQAIDEGRDVLAFRLQMSMPTDNDGLNDTWGFWSGNNRNLDRRPTITYQLPD